MTDTTDFFDNTGGGPGSPTALLKNPGDYVHGEIVEMFKRDYVPFGAQTPEKREDGTTKQQLVIVLQTAFRNWQGVVKVPKANTEDPNSPEKAPSEDDGKRAIYVPEGKNIQFAIGRAVQAKGVPFQTGGTLGVKIDKLTPTTKGNPLKEHVAVYEPPNAAAGFIAPAPDLNYAAPAAPAPAPAAPAPAPAAPVAEAPPAPAAPAPAPAAPAQEDPWGAPAKPTDAPPF